MLSEVNFTITITDSMGNVSRTVEVYAGDCTNAMICGDHLSEFRYNDYIGGLRQHELVNVSINTIITSNSTMHVVRTPMVNITTNVTIPGE